MCLLLESNEFWVKRFVSVLPEIQVNVIYNMYNKKYYLGGRFMKEEEIVLKVENYIKDKMYNESSGHDWWHVKRVHDLALKINENENVNEFTVKMIALLHDIYDSKFIDGNVRDNLIELMEKLDILNDCLPVIGVPVKSSTLDGIDALLSTVQMPSGIPVATVAIDGAVNAALLSVQMLAIEDKDAAERLQAKRDRDAQKVLEKDAALSAKYL